MTSEPAAAMSATGGCAPTRKASLGEVSKMDRGRRLSAAATSHSATIHPRKNVMLGLNRFAMKAVLRHVVIMAALAGLFIAAAPTVALAQSPPAQFDISILSSPAYAVTGGDALVQVSVPGATPLADVVVRLNGQDVTAAFQAADAFTLKGLVAGLRVGPNVLTAGPRSTGQILAKILVTNYPITGPVLSGPHQTPFVCETEFLGLGAPLDPDCSASTRVDY